MLLLRVGPTLWEQVGTRDVPAGALGDCCEPGCRKSEAQRGQSCPEGERSFGSVICPSQTVLPAHQIHSTVPGAGGMRSTQQGRELSSEPISHLCLQCSLQQPQDPIPVVISLPANHPEAERGGQVGVKLLCSLYQQSLCFQGSKTKLISSAMHSLAGLQLTGKATDH